MSNQKFQYVSELFGQSASDIASTLQTVPLKDRAKGAAYGAGIGGAIGGGVGGTIGLFHAFRTLTKDLGPTDQHELKNATLKYIEQNKLSPTKDREQIYQFSKAYARKLSRKRFLKTVGTSTLGGATTGVSTGAGVGALIGSDKIKEFLK